MGTITAIQIQAMAKNFVGDGARTRNLAFQDGIPQF